MRLQGAYATSSGYLTHCHALSYLVGMSNVQPAPAESLQRSIDAIIGANVHQLMWSRQETQTTVAPDWGMDQSTLSMKLRGKRPWFAAEIVAAANRYSVSVAALFTDSSLNEHTLDYGAVDSARLGRPIQQERRAPVTDIRTRFAS